VDLPPSAVGKDCLGLRPVNALPIVGRLGPRRDNTPVRIETAEQYSRSIPYLAFKASFITLPPGWPASMLKVLSALRL
jgi:hypothetical protein